MHLPFCRGSYWPMHCHMRPASDIYDLVSITQKAHVRRARASVVVTADTVHCVLCALGIWFCQRTVGIYASPLAASLAPGGGGQPSEVGQVQSSCRPSADPIALAPVVVVVVVVVVDSGFAGPALDL